MNKILSLLSGCGLTLTILPSLLFFAGSTGLNTAQYLMTAGMILWFAADGVRAFRRNTTP